MIDQHVLRNAESLRQSFQTARPFKHLCIEGFFDEQAAEALLRDFPPFEAGMAINEYGEIGRKAVHARLKQPPPQIGIKKAVARSIRYRLGRAVGRRSDP